MTLISDITIGQIVRVTRVTKPANAFMVGQDVKIISIEGNTLMCASGSGSNPNRYTHSGRISLGVNQVAVIAPVVRSENDG